MVYLSADHLARIFKKETGETLVKYITDSALMLLNLSYLKQISRYHKYLVK